MMKLLVILPVLCYAVVYVAGGVAKDVGLNCPLGVNILNATCPEDCKLQHGATGGDCGGVNCYCSGSAATGFQNLATQCQNSTGDLKTGYETLCSADCKCNHGALDGTCDFTKYFCKCGTNATTTACNLTQTDILNIITKFKLPMELNSMFK